jgi:hypothetical protein
MACASASFAGDVTRFADKVGPVPVGEVDLSGEVQINCITWGGESALLAANGGVKTTPDSVFGKMGLKFKLVKQDNPVQQTRDYISGTTPFWRGTFRMGGIAAEKMAEDERTRGVVAVQLTWSAGDHVVAKESVRTLADLKGTTGCMQEDGPHIGLVDDALRTASLTWDDINVKLLPELTASPDSPAERFRKDECDWATVISPDMTGLTGGCQADDPDCNPMNNIGSGAEGTVKGAHVLVSTSEMSRSIADIFIVRADVKKSNPEFVDKFVAGYMKGSELVTDWKKAYESQGSKEYMALLQMTQDFLGAETLPTLEEDAHGLISDCRFVGHPGNVKFFEDPQNTTGFAAFAENSANLAVSRGYATNRVLLLPPKFNYTAIASAGALTKTKVVTGNRFNAEAVQKEIESFSQGALDDRTVYSFTINFEPNQLNFPVRQYETEFRKAIDMTRKYGNAVLGLRAHSDPSKTLIELVRAGMKKGVLKRTGGPGNWQYTLNGRPLDIGSTGEVIRLIEAGAFDGVEGHNPREIMQAALNLARRRADAVLSSVVQFASAESLPLDKSQFQPLGVGIREPFIPKPRNFEEALQNMRVEFRLIRVDAEVATDSDFDF